VFAIYYGEDDYSRNEAVRALRDRLGDPEMASLNTTVLSAAQARPGEVIAQASIVPFLASGRLVVVEGLLAEFEARAAGASGRRRASSSGSAAGGRKGGKKASAAEAGEDDGLRGWGALKDVAAALPETNMLVLSDGPVGASNPLLKHLASVGEVREFQPLRGPALAEWARRRAASQGGVIASDAVQALVESCGSNLWAMDAEVTKLVLYADGRTITRQDAEALVADVREENMFALVDDVVAGQYAQARGRLEKLLEAGAGVGQVIAMLATQLRRLIAAKDLTARKASRQALEEGIGSRSDFAVKKAVGQAQRFSLEQLVWMHRRLLDYDLAVKTGELVEETALEMLLMELAGADGRRR
jgi:DNA polymerase-3 subunit delta